MTALAESSGNGWCVAVACTGDVAFQLDPISRRMEYMRSTIMSHDPLDSPMGTPYAKSHTMPTACRLNRWRGHSATGSHAQREFAKSASLLTFSARHVTTAFARSG